MKKYKIQKINLKIGTAIFLYSLLVTIAFIAVLFFLQYSAGSSVGSQSNSVKGIYFLDNNEMQYIYSGQYILVTPTEVTTVNEYNTNFLSQIFANIFPVSVIFCLLLFLLSVLLWIILKRMQNKNMLQIVHKLNAIADDSSLITDNPALESAYENIRAKFSDYLNDYKRLNSYLSHEQKNAIAILRTNLELNENTTYLANLDYISDSIDDVLTLSETTEMNSKATVDVSLVCAAVCDSYLKLTKNITFQFIEDGNTEIFAKERWIYRAIANLLDNAVKYGNNNAIEVTVKTKNNSVIVSVKDHGIGISSDKQDKIFNHRYRINELNKDGYGIGLSLVSHVCDLCGGFAMVESEENKGSTFYLSFPQKNSQVNIQ
ncbi:MAG: HAMP domain-containing sensor histidine kinase [Candidatus Izemoplasmatales bacterium]